MRLNRAGPIPRLLLILVLIACAHPARGDDARAVAAFDEGVALTREGRFEAALERFIAAREAGDRSARLAFNLGVVFYRLQRHAEARAAFEDATHFDETADLAYYNLGLVALAVDDRAQAERWFRRTVDQARQPALRRLGMRALTEGLGLSAPRAARGSLALLRGHDSNVLIPVGAISDLPTSRGDPFWEARGGWADALGTRVPGLGYRIAGLAVEYDEVDVADLGVIEAGIDWRGPILIEAAVGALLVGDRGYQRSLDVRLQAPLLENDALRIALDGGFTRLNPLDSRAEDLQGSQYSLGASADFGSTPWRLSLAYRRLENDRRSAALSPDQDRALARLRLVFGPVVARAWSRYTASDYPTGRDDQATEFGADLALRLHPRWEWLVEATRLDNRSSVEGFDYRTDRVYTGVRLRF